MTETISTADNSRRPHNGFFKKYLFFNLTANKVYLLASLILSVMAALVFVIISILSVTVFNSAFRETQGFINFFSIASIFGLYLVSITSGIRCFQSLTRSNKTDTLMCLPLTHAERFWGDFLTGYITSAAPIIPCGILGIVVAAIAPKDTGALKFVLVYEATLFFVMTFAYLLSVLAASVCGNRGGGIVTAVLLGVISGLLFPCWVGFVQFNIIGFSTDVSATMLNLAEYIPSPALFADLTDIFSIFSFDFPRITESLSTQQLAIENPLNVCVYILLCAGVTALAFFISKYRQCERTGETFAAKHSAVVTIILTAVTAMGLCLISFAHRNYIVFALLASFLVLVCVFVAAELILRLGTKKLGRRIVIYAAATCAALGFAFLASAARGFGMTYYIPSADNIVSAEVVDKPIKSSLPRTYHFDTREDIEQLRTNHIQLLKSESANLQSQNRLTITYTLKNGSKFTRSYGAIDISGKKSDYERVLQSLEKLPSTLSSYPAQYAALLDARKADSITVTLGGILETIQIKPDKESKFIAILKSDIENCYRPDALPIGQAYLVNSYTFDILETYKNTIAFLSDSSNIETNESLEAVYTIYLIGGDCRIEFSVLNNELDLPAVKELEGLMKSFNPYDYDTLYSKEVQNSVMVVSPDFYRHYIPNENIPKVIALISQIASQRV
ncbi:MAG: hypothetical protein ACI4JY_01705 [Oscillospiraceae bacterium]